MPDSKYYLSQGRRRIGIILKEEQYVKLRNTALKLSFESNKTQTDIGAVVGALIDLHLEDPLATKKKKPASKKKRA